MNDTEQRIAIAKHLGLLFYHENEKMWAVKGSGCFTSEEHACWRLPDYPEDLNACVDFEKTLTDDQLKTYDGWLITIAGTRSRRATAKERCEAFCLTLGLMKP